MFTYSREEGTPAAKMDGQISEELKQERKDIIMDIQRNISAEKCRSFEGKELKVILRANFLTITFTAQEATEMLLKLTALCLLKAKKNFLQAIL